MTLVPVVTFGLIIGSFLNVVIARLPERRSLWMPGSTCPGCGNAIAWHDNIPLVSFVMLRGRCRACATPIPWRYPIVEASTAVLFAIAWLIFGNDLPQFVVAVVFLAALVAITVIDLRHQIIPDAITLPGVVAGIVASVATDRISWIQSVVGILLGGGLFVAVILLSRGGMGGGDLKLGAMLGAFLGWQALLVALFVAVMLGGVSAVALLAAGRVARKDAIPFGPFLAIGGAVALFWGDAILAWYLGGFER
jgi:leader peptidase (prepilin peptidase)/N-methyltransferase